jgi:hypothetical protein
MKKLAILNTTIVTTDGYYRMNEITLEEAKNIIKTYNYDNNILSAIGHQSTADILTELLDVKIETNRILFQQEAGQKALCFKLNGRPPEGQILSKEELEEIGYTFKLLEKL